LRARCVHTPHAPMHVERMLLLVPWCRHPTTPQRPLHSSNPTLRRLVWPATRGNARGGRRVAWTRGYRVGESSVSVLLVHAKASMQRDPGGSTHSSSIAARGVVGWTRARYPPAAWCADTPLAARHVALTPPRANQAPSSPRPIRDRGWGRGPDRTGLNRGLEPENAATQS
jgi:hypothetical protein